MKPYQKLAKKLVFAGLLSLLASFFPAFAQKQIAKPAVQPVPVPASVSEWEQKLKPKVFSFFEEQIYGAVPNFKPEFSWKVIETGKTENYTRKQIETTLILNKTDTFKMLYLVLIPLGKPRALLAGYNFDGNHTIFPDRHIILSKAWCNNDVELGIVNFRSVPLSRGSDAESWPVITIMDSGCALVTCMYHDFEPDYPNSWKNGIRQAVAKSTGKNLGPEQWGAISLWAFGLANMAEAALNTTPELKGLPVYAVGHSRLGKTALWAGVKYPVFTGGVFTNNSGCLGSKLNKPMRGETFSVINRKFPHWFADNCKLWNDRDSTLPYDQNWLLALVAPRHLYVTSAEKDKNADPAGEFEAWKLSLPIWNLYSKQVIIAPEKPLLNNPILNSYSGYHYRSGLHNFAYYDWEGFLRAVSKWNNREK